MALIRNAIIIILKYQQVKLKEKVKRSAESRLGNKSAFLCAVLIYSANKIDQYLIKLKLFSMFPDFVG